MNVQWNKFHFILISECTHHPDDPYPQKGEENDRNYFCLQEVYYLESLISKILKAIILIILPSSSQQSKVQFCSFSREEFVFQSRWKCQSVCENQNRWFAAARKTCLCSCNKLARERKQPSCLNLSRKISGKSLCTLTAFLHPMASCWICVSSNSWLNVTNSSKVPMRCVYWLPTNPRPNSTLPAKIMHGKVRTLFNLVCAKGHPPIPTQTKDLWRTKGRFFAMNGRSIQLWLLKTLCNVVVFSEKGLEFHPDIRGRPEPEALEHFFCGSGQGGLAQAYDEDQNLPCASFKRLHQMNLQEWSFSSFFCFIFFLNEKLAHWNNFFVSNERPRLRPPLEISRTKGSAEALGLTGLHPHKTHCKYSCVPVAMFQGQSRNSRFSRVWYKKYFFALVQFSSKNFFGFSLLITKKKNLEVQLERTKISRDNLEPCVWCFTTAGPKTSSCPFCWSLQHWPTPDIDQFFSFIPIVFFPIFNRCTRLFPLSY